MLVSSNQGRCGSYACNLPVKESRHLHPSFQVKDGWPLNLLSFVASKNTGSSEGVVVSKSISFSKGHGACLLISPHQGSVAFVIVNSNN